MRQQRIKPGPNQESVWDYPRPPRVEASTRHIQVVFGGVMIADTRNSRRVLETSHPPVYCIPLEDITAGCLAPSDRSSFCEWKGRAKYHTVKAGDREAVDAAWSYPTPAPHFASIKNYVAFYPAMMDDCYVDGESVTKQPGDFYGGWITSDIVGPFKGGPGTSGW